MQQQQSSEQVPWALANPSVTVTRGEHRHPIPHGLGEMVSAELASRGITGSYNLRMGPTVLGTSAMPRLKVVRVTARGTVELRCKPGGNDSARICWLSLPSGTDTTDAVATAEKLAAMLRDNKGGNGMAKAAGAGHGFTSRHENLQAVLKVLCASGAKGKWLSVDRAKRELMGSGVGPASMTKAGWGQVLGAMSRRELLELQRSGEDLVAVRVPEKHVPQEMNEGSSGPIHRLGIGHVLAKPVVHTSFPMPSTVDRRGLQQWLQQLAGIEEGLLSQLVVAEDNEKKAKGVYERIKQEADTVREQMAKAGQAVGAAKLLLEMMK